jgi:hypothetical protein
MEILVKINKEVKITKMRRRKGTLGVRLSLIHKLPPPTLKSLEKWSAAQIGE